MAIISPLVELAIRNLDAARRAGFDTARRWYHGSAGPERFDEIDAARRGAITDSPAAREATFLTSDPGAAAGFADLAAQRTGQPAQIHQMVYRPDGNYAAVDWQAAFPDIPMRSENGQRLLAGILADAKEQGLPGVLIQRADDATTGGHLSDVLAVVDRTRLRYPEAEFKDPASPNLLAQLVPGAVGLSALAIPSDTEAAPRDIGGYEPEEFPRLEALADQLDRVRLPIPLMEQPLNPLAELLRNVGRERPVTNRLLEIANIVL